MDEASPLGVFLVKSGSKGDRLLFRYPYALDTQSETNVNKKRKNPYSLLVSEDTIGAKTAETSHKNLASLVQISDKALSNLFATKSELCNQKFEVKVNKVRFVGHPMQLSRQVATSILMFNVVFALRANASQDIVSFYHDFTHKIAIALRAEDKRCNYLSTELRSMLQAHDDTVAMPEDSEESPYHLILKRSQLARDLQRAYNELHSSGSVHLRINKWINVSFCLPNKVHRLSLTKNSVKADAIQKCLLQLRPYHALLLLVDSRELTESLPNDSSAALVRLVAVASPVRSLAQLAADSDLTLKQVFQLAAHLVYWAKATIIYPLCESNCYVLAPNAPTDINSPIHERFAEKFPGVSLPAFMSKFSVPTSLSQLNDPMDLKNERKQLLQILVWMLQEHILMQLHTYIYLVAAEHHMEIMAHDLASSVTDAAAGSPSSQSDDGRAGLSWEEKEALQRVSAYRNPEDRKLFLRLCPRFRGQHHMEEIMYYENVKRSHLLALLDKFRDVLLTVQHQDPSISVFYS
ncbi:GATOR1 complex protein NPRL3-like [Ornithodoros turicata]|uniref:GATOR complex protein NPRL3 n=1 Tax=Ornithodoros turicata TaxID=34597 RepID=A0A2R5LLM3_9ACAR